ncbi:MAG: ankyrin repeat domain-containing protein [Dehalococcoidia bacterium]|nr:ankyrin repeat domain-containing protein [Dehalococcoidia bacterium]
MFSACASDSVRRVGALLRSNPKLVNCRKAPLHETPLHCAATLASTEMVNLLIRQGANLQAVNSDNETPLMYAVQAGRADTAQALMAAGSDPNVADRNHNPPLFFALMIGDCKLVRLLVDGGADVNARLDSAGLFHPLDLALVRHEKNVAEYLRKHGARTHPLNR